MKTTQLTALSPLDGRYADKLSALCPIFSEYGLMRYRLIVEIRWLQALAKHPRIKELPAFSTAETQYLDTLIENFSPADAKKIKNIECTTHHDVKAIEYFIKSKLAQHATLHAAQEFVHFGCTSEDINNTAYALMIQDGLKQMLHPILQKLTRTMHRKANQYAHIPMLSRTHGQPATPTTMGKEWANFAYRLTRQHTLLQAIRPMAKCNGAVGNYNAHVAAYPHINWQTVSKQFITGLKLTWNSHTTQIEPHDWTAELCHTLMRCNTICTDFARDIWGYISLDYFSQKTQKGSIGSSTMPHKINPIDFENAEGNLGLANALLQHFANKLPISRWQRDLSDSTVLRNIGTAFGHTVLAYTALLQGISKLKPNLPTMKQDLNQHWEILAEPLQTVMRRYGITQPYEKIKELTRGKSVNRETLHAFIATLDLPESVKQELYGLTPDNYLGYATTLATTKNPH